MAKPVATELDASLLVRKGEVPESAKPPAPTPVEGRMIYSYRVRLSDHAKLRERAFHTKTTIQELIDGAVRTMMESWD